MNIHYKPPLGEDVNIFKHKDYENKCQNTTSDYLQIACL